jgi:hypothetical protein
MPVVSGKLIDFGEIPLGVGAQVVFTASESAVSNANVFATRPVIAVPGDNGNWTVSLRPTLTARPLMYYKVSLRWLTPGDPDGGYTSIDFPEWRLYIGLEDATLSDLVDTRGTTNPYMVYVGPTEPPFKRPNLFWLKTSDGSKLYRTKAI